MRKWGIIRALRWGRSYYCPPETSANLFIISGDLLASGLSVGPREAARRRPSLCPLPPLQGKTRQPQPDAESFSGVSSVSPSSVVLIVVRRSLRLRVSAVTSLKLFVINAAVSGRSESRRPVGACGVSSSASSASSPRMMRRFLLFMAALLGFSLCLRGSPGHG